MFWCIYFRVQVHLVDAVREMRNTKWGHAARQELTDGEKVDALTDIRNLLQDPELATDKDAKAALSEINLMENHFDAQSVERKVLADFQVTVKGQLDGIGDELKDLKRNCASVSRDLKRNCASVSRKVQKKLSSLENKQTKMLKLLQGIEDRMEDERNRNISYATQVSNLAKCVFSASKHKIVSNLRSLNTRSLAVWMVVIVLMGSFRCLNHNSYNDGCPLETGSVPFDTKEFNFTRNLNAARESFTGRHWLYQELESLLREQHNVTGVVVVGEPGTGKSALTAQLICSRSSNPFIHKRIIGYHLCRYSDQSTQDPGRLVRSLVHMIARRVPEYGMLISSSTFILEILQKSCLRDPFDCFEKAVVAPLRQLKNELPYYFIVIDALDECSTYDSGTAIAQFIEETFSMLPRWVRVVMTSRNDSSVLRHFTKIPQVYLSPTDVRNLQDIEIFIANKLFEDARFLDKLKIMLGFSSGEEIAFMTNKLLNQSQGNFLFAKEMFHFWRNDWNNQIDFNHLPKTLGGIYESYLRRVYRSREKFKSALAVLEVMVAAFEPLHIDRLFQVLKMREKIDYEYDFVYTLKGLSHFIRYGEGNTISIFHLSFTEWLTSSENLGNPYYVSRSHGHRRLAEYYLNVVKKAQNSSMDIYRLAQHINFEDADDSFLEEFRNIKASYINATIDRNNRTLLHLAAANNNRRILQLLIPAFETIDCEDNYGFTPAFVSAMYGLADNVDFLLGMGANIEHRTKPPPFPGFVVDDDVVLGDPIERSTKAFWHSTMMHAAASGGHIDVIRGLLKRNASFQVVNGVNLSAIQLAAKSGHLKVVQLLFQSGAQVDHVTLQHAAAGGHSNVVNFLLRVGVTDECARCDGSFYWLQNRIRYQAIPHCKRNDVKEYALSDDKFKILCQSALHLAVAGSHTDVVKVLLSQSDNTAHCVDFTGRTPLHEAVRRNNVYIAELLIFKGARVSQKCWHFQNISSNVHWMPGKCKNDRPRGKECSFLSRKEQEDYNKDVCHCGSSPFLLAARYGYVEVASLLLHHGAQPRDSDCQGATPLHVAACHGHYNFIRWLISQRPYLHINFKSKNRSTPLHSGAICTVNKNIIPLIEMGASIYETDQRGMTPLHYAVLNRFEKTASVLSYTAMFGNPYSDSFNMRTFIWSSKGDFTIAGESHSEIERFVFNFQCYKLQQISLLQTRGGNNIVNKADYRGRTALHLAAKNGEECSVMTLLEMGARADLTDLNDKTPLDNAIEFAPDILNPHFEYASDVPRPHFESDIGNIVAESLAEQFDMILAFNERHHSSVARILLSREAHLTRKCDQKVTSLLHRAFEKGQAVIAYHILSMGGSLECKDDQGRSPLLVYLQNGGKWLDVVLNRFNVTIHVECDKPFNKSEFHLLAFTNPTVLSENLFEKHVCDLDYCYSEDGPLMKAIKAHPSGFRVVDECRDAEGYTALHRAAQGGNLLGLRTFLSWGANPTVLTPHGHSSLDLAIMCAGASPFSSNEGMEIAERAADLLLRATKSMRRFNIGCSSGQAKLTVFHLSAYRGLSGFVKTLFNDTTLGVDVNCTNLHGITPLYLAKLKVGTVNNSDAERDQWQEIIDLIEKHGGVLTNPSREVELNVIYRHLYGSYPSSFTLDEFEANGKQFYESEVSACRKGDLNYYQTGTLINPYLGPVHSEVTRIIAESLPSAKTKLVVLDNKVLQKTLKTLFVALKALDDVSRLWKDITEGLKQAELMEITRPNFLINASTVLSIKFPKRLERRNITQQLLQNKKNVSWQEQSLRKSRFSWESTKEIMSLMNKRLKSIFHGYSEFFDTTKLLQLLEKYDESQLCMEEIFQARLMTIKFHTFVVRSQVDDLVSFMRSSLMKADYLSKRIPREWTKAAKNGWNQAVKFLYKQATQRDLAFDYLKDLSLGWDKETRIPLSVDALCNSAYTC